ncbi:MAG TPA: hydroxymethylbilane synthase [Acidobacteriaceae bacterium]|jgi:hydroxymethylbilane synthase|nr:hydroxymethylbilane synthase [Acidobacteriaceae bacterium]
MSKTIRIGSRGSQLALWQADHIADKLRAAGHTVEIEVIRTAGDRLQHEPSTVDAPSLAPIGGKGIFIKEIEEALADGRIDLAVHSLKDLPTELDRRFILAAIPPRADARDAWVCDLYWALHTLPEGGRIGTTSPRRKAMLLALRPDVMFVEMRGNVDTRLRKLSDGQCDALVLASAGLERLNRTESVHYRFAVEELCPAPGQGALALQTRDADYAALFEPGHDEYVRNAVAAFDDPTTRFAVEAERIVLDALGGGCQVPIGAHCRPVLEGDSVLAWNLHAQVVAPDGEQVLAVTIDAPTGISASALALQCAEELKARGALELLGAAAAG